MDKLVIGEIDRKYMEEAFKEAEKALQENEVPIGCVIAFENKIIGRGHNRTETLQDPTAHAEIIAITAAAEFLDSWRLTGSTIYSTIEPCIMCAGALMLARAERLVFGASDPKFGGCGSIMNIVAEKKLNHRISVTEGVLAEKCAGIMQEFFRKKRKGDHDEV